MGTRLQLHEMLQGVLGSEYEGNCYYSPPSNVKLRYPCIKYDISGDGGRYADNLPYRTTGQWTVTVVDEDPDSEIAKDMKKLPYCSFDRSYNADGLKHFVFTLYY